MINQPLGNTESLIAIALMSVITYIVRGLPFWLFAGKNLEPPKALLYLGKVLPYSVIALLVIYCYKSTDITQIILFVPSLLAGLCVAALQAWKKNTLISVFSGIAVFIVLSNFV